MRQLSRMRLEYIEHAVPMRPVEAHVVDLMNIILSTKGVHGEVVVDREPQVIHSVIGPNSYGRLGDWFFLQIKQPEQRAAIPMQVSMTEPKTSAKATGANHRRSSR